MLNQQQKMKQIYLDNAATTKVDNEVVKAMIPYYTEKYGNASSSHFLGEEARRDIEEARAFIAKTLGASYKEVIFTSSGTESNNFVLKGLFFAHYPEKDHIIVSKIEHDCILNACKWLETQGAKITYLNVDKEGFVDLNQLKNSITDKTIVISIIPGNNETGTIQNLAEIGKICKEKNTYFHTDACQSYMKTNLDVNKQNLDLVTINAHKIHGPKGIGALYIKKGIEITPLLHGGGQEFKLRSATENVPGIIGFARAVKLIRSSEIKRMVELRDYLIKELLKIPDSKLNGATEDRRLCNNINIQFRYVEGEALGSLLNIKGISISTGSACSSKSVEPSHVLKAMGLNNKEAENSIRISLSKFTTKEDIDFTINEIKKAVEKLRKISKI